MHNVFQTFLFPYQDNYLQENFTIRANNINNKLIGGNLLFQSIPWINRLQIFNYQILEPGQIAEKEYLL